jgi:hypothetical protein
MVIANSIASPPWCVIGDGWPVSRFNWCLETKGSAYEYTVSATGVVTPKGQLFFTATQWMTTAYNSQSWPLTLAFKNESEWGTFLTGLVKPTMLCSAGCTLAANPAEALTTTVPGNWYGQYYTVSTHAGNPIYVVQQLTLEFLSTSGARPKVTALQTPDSRCDNTIANTGPGGCVLSSFTPAYPESLSDPAVAQAVAVDLNGQWGIASHPGANYSNLHGVPLHRSTSSTIKNANRAVSCPTSWPRPSGMQCDEYPYASTLEGAASGGGYHAEMILQGHNSMQGGRLGWWLTSNRIFDREAYWVAISS